MRRVSLDLPFEAAVARAGRKGSERAPGGTANAGGEPARVDIRFTAKGNSVYAICLDWPAKEVVVKAFEKNGVAGQKVATDLPQKLIKID